MSKLLDNDNFLYMWTRIKQIIGGKVDKESGKGLSSNDYTDSEKNKLLHISDNANNHSHPTGDGNKHVPATGTTSNGKFLAAGSNAGDLVWTKLTKAMITALGIPEQDTVYTHPAYSSRNSGLYKITVDDMGHITAVTPVNKNDITALGIAGENTTYSPATQSANGLMSASDKQKLDAFNNAGNYALKSDLAGMYKYKGSKATYAELPNTGNSQGDVWNVVAEKGMNYAWNGTEWDALGEIFQYEVMTNAEIDAIINS